jgi:hypothetical protein
MRPILTHCRFESSPQGSSRRARQNHEPGFKGKEKARYPLLGTDTRAEAAVFFFFSPSPASLLGLKRTPSGIFLDFGVVSDWPTPFPRNPERRPSPLSLVFLFHPSIPWSTTPRSLLIYSSPSSNRRQTSIIVDYRPCSLF